jgi:hypothetical protein
MYGRPSKSQSNILLEGHVVLVASELEEKVKTPVVPSISPHDSHKNKVSTIIQRSVLRSHLMTIEAREILSTMT